MLKASPRPALGPAATACTILYGTSFPSLFILPNQISVSLSFILMEGFKKAGTNSKNCLQNLKIELHRYDHWQQLKSSDPI